MRASRLRLRLAPASIAAALPVGCAGTEPASHGLLPWRDAAFACVPARVSVTRETLFALDPDRARGLRVGPAAATGNRATRTAELLLPTFGLERQAFAYAGGRSTAAAETWRHGRGSLAAPNQPSRTRSAARAPMRRPAVAAGLTTIRPMRASPPAGLARTAVPVQNRNEPVR